MINNIMRQYYDKSPWTMPVAVDVLTPGDYHLYLYASEALRIESDVEEPQRWYVVVEADYLFMDEIVKDITFSFPVEVQGWCVLKEAQKDGTKDLLATDTFKGYDASNASDSQWANYQRVLYSADMNYVLLRVTPLSGVSINDFGLSYYKQLNTDKDGTNSTVNADE